MKGSYQIRVSNAKVRYDFTIRRNITIIKGNSATGKTTLVELIREYYESGEDSGVELNCKKNCRVLAGKDWKIILASVHESIIFIDEDNAFLPTNEFAEMARKSDNYYVIVTREGLPNLPYSVEEIYGIRESGKYATLKQTYHEFYHIYGRDDYSKPIKPETIIVEDSNAGYDFFARLSMNGGYSVISAKGKSNIFAEIMKQSQSGLLIIGDGAAFGPEMDRVMKMVNRNKDIALYLPESFEWIILNSGIIPDKNISTILEEPSDFIESSKYFSWERYFTFLLVSITEGTYLKYSKRKLNEVYMQEELLKKIADKIAIIKF